MRVAVGESVVSAMEPATFRVKLTVAAPSEGTETILVEGVNLFSKNQLTQQENIQIFG